MGGEWNALSKPTSKPCGWISTGLSIQQLIGRATPQGGSQSEKARAAKTFHVILGGKDPIQLPDDIKEIVEKIIHMSDEQLNAVAEQMAMKVGKDDAIKTLLAMTRYHLESYQRGLARAQYEEISRNQGVKGIFEVVEPNARDIKRGADALTSRLIESFEQLAGVRAGTVGTKELEQRANQITQTFYAIVGACGGQI